MKTGSWIARMTLAAVGVVALTVVLSAPVGANAAERISMHNSPTYGGYEHHAHDHDADRHHYVRHHFGGRPNATYYIYPYYPVPTYTAPTYWYYCPSYGMYYPYATSCPESWVPVPAS